MLFPFQPFQLQNEHKGNCFESDFETRVEIFSSRPRRKFWKPNYPLALSAPF